MRFLDFARNDKVGRFNVEGDTQIVAELLQITGVRLVMDILHPHMDRFDGESRVLYSGTLCQQFRQQERVLAARESHEYLVIIFYQMISSHRLDEPFFQTVFKATALYRLISLLHADACPCSGQHDDHRPWRGSR